MNLERIKALVDAGVTVNWGNKGYEVRKEDDSYLIVYVPTGNCSGLTHKRTGQLNEREEDFFINLDQIRYCVDDAGAERHKDFLTCYPTARLVGCELKPRDVVGELRGFPREVTWVAAWSYLPDVTLTDEEAYDLASDLLIERGLLPVTMKHAIQFKVV